MQETLLDELSATRRVRLHGRIGEALEQRWGDLADERATRLARHFVESATLTERHAEKAFHYSRQSYGVSRVYRRKAGAAFEENEGLERAALYIVPLWGVLHRSAQAPES